MSLYLHDFDCRSYESLQTSPLISYATMVWLEPQFALIHTVIDLIWLSSALIRSSAEAASGHMRHCICIWVDCRSYESLQTSSLISYTVIVWLEPGCMLIHTVIDLIWGSSAVIFELGDDAAAAHIFHYQQEFHIHYSMNLLSTSLLSLFMLHCKFTVINFLASMTNATFSILWCWMLSPESNVC